jgi:hypothetical protein
VVHKVEGEDIPKKEIVTKKYTMKIEFGTAKDGKIPGKIHLRMPDEAGSFVVGTFEAEIKQPMSESTRCHHFSVVRNNSKK